MLSDHFYQSLLDGRREHGVYMSEQSLLEKANQKGICFGSTFYKGTTGICFGSTFYKGTTGICFGSTFYKGTKMI